MGLIHNVDIFVIAHDTHRNTYTHTLRHFISFTDSQNRIEGWTCSLPSQNRFKTLLKLYTRNRNLQRAIVEFAAHLCYILINRTEPNNNELFPFLKHLKREKCCIYWYYYVRDTFKTLGKSECKISLRWNE